MDVNKVSMVCMFKFLGFKLWVFEFVIFASNQCFGFALLFILKDHKLQNILGHFQKDFEGDFSAENLGMFMRGSNSSSSFGSQSVKLVLSISLQGRNLVAMALSCQLINVPLFGLIQRHLQNLRALQGLDLLTSYQGRYMFFFSSCKCYNIT